MCWMRSGMSSQGLRHQADCGLLLGTRPLVALSLEVGAIRIHRAPRRKKVWVARSVLRLGRLRSRPVVREEVEAGPWVLGTI